LSKYAPLRKYLTSGSQTRWRVTFAEVEAVLGFSLPRSAYAYPAWWSNDATGHSHSRVWLDAGWKTEQVDMAARKLVFRRTGAGGEEKKTSSSPPAVPVIGVLKGTVMVAAGVDLTEPTGRALAGR